MSDPLTTPDALALIAAIDAGEDDCLPILADLLEEAGGGAAGLRLVIKCGKLPLLMGAEWCWIPTRQYALGLPNGAAHHVPRWLAVRMNTTDFASRSAAILALAEALPGEDS